MYRIELNVGPTDFAVSRAVKELEEIGKPFTREDIARKINCSETTVDRSCSRLLKAGILKMTGSKRTGYTLKFVGDKPDVHLSGVY